MAMHIELTHRKNAIITRSVRVPNSKTNQIKDETLGNLQHEPTRLDPSNQQQHRCLLCLCFWGRLRGVHCPHS